MRIHTVMPSPIGGITLVAEDGALTGCYLQIPQRGPDDDSLGQRDDDSLGQRDDDGMGQRPDGMGQRDDASLRRATTELTEYFAGERTEFTVPLQPRGDAFQQKVWALLREIPYGQTRSYGDLARPLGDVNLSQAVGWANGRNPISIIVPCHRVIGADGSLVGYAGGLDRKRFLLALEEPPADEANRLF